MTFILNKLKYALKQLNEKLFSHFALSLSVMTATLCSPDSGLVLPWYWTFVCIWGKD